MSRLLYRPILKLDYIDIHRIHFSRLLSPHLQLDIFFNQPRTPDTLSGRSVNELIKTYFIYSRPETNCERKNPFAADWGDLDGWGVACREFARKKIIGASAGDSGAASNGHWRNPTEMAAAHVFCLCAPIPCECVCVYRHSIIGKLRR